MNETTHVIPLSGELTAATAPAVRKQLRSLVEEGSVKLVLDLSAVSFIDSSGLSALVTTFKAARAAGGDVALLNPQPTVRSLLELTRLHRVFQIFEDRETALSGLAA